MSEIQGSEVYRDGLQHGVAFYSDPLALTAEMIDPLLWPAVERINRSGWCWTAESCQGHPDAAGWMEAWAGNVRPMLRLVCKIENRGRLLDALLDAATSVEWGKPDADLLGPNIASMHLYPQRARSPWFVVLVYLDAATVFDRNLGCRVYERFAELVAPSPAPAAEGPFDFLGAEPDLYGPEDGEPLPAPAALAEEPYISGGVAAEPVCNCLGACPHRVPAPPATATCGTCGGTGYGTWHNGSALDDQDYYPRRRPKSRCPACAPAKPSRWYFRVDWQETFEWDQPTISGAQVRGRDGAIPADHDLCVLLSMAERVPGQHPFRVLALPTAVYLSADPASPTEFFTAPPATFGTATR